MLRRTSGAELRRSICDKDGDQPEAGGQQCDRTGRAPAERLGLDDPEDEHDEAGRDRDGARQVERTRCGLNARLRDEPQRQGEGRDPDWDVDNEDPRPRDELSQRAAEEQADGAATGRDRAPHAERLGPVLLLGERRRDDRQRGGRHERAAEALQRPAGDQHPGCLGEPIQQRCRAEHDDAHREQPLAAEQVGRAPAEQQKAAEDERVGVDDPLEVRCREVQAALD